MLEKKQDVFPRFDGTFIKEEQLKVIPVVVDITVLDVVSDDVKKERRNWVFKNVLRVSTEEHLHLTS